jgi:hypothetical protein
MKTDLYTKVVLTIIAVCVCLIVIQKSPLIGDAQAQQQQQVHVWIDGSNSYSLQYAGPIAVKQLKFSAHRPHGLGFARVKREIYELDKRADCYRCNARPDRWIAVSD